MSNITYIARELRKKQTLAENLFWQNVRNRKVNNHKLYRQFPIEFLCENTKRHFIADFYCYDSKLVVEIDGGIHEQQKEYDKLRTEVINQLGIRVVRFSNEEVMSDMDQVIDKLKEVLV